MQSITKIDWSTKKVLLFDWDGTLVDSMSAWARADAELLKTFCKLITPPNEAHRRTEQFLKNYRGTTDAYLAYVTSLILRHNIKDITPRELLTWRIAKANEILLQAGYKDGAAEAMLTAKSLGFKLGLVTTTSREQLNICRSQNKFISNQAPIDDTFDIILDADSGFQRKPNPALYLMAMSQFGFSANQFIAFEDSLVGVQSAKAAGLEVIRVYDEYSALLLPQINQLADYSLDHWRDLSF